MPARSTAAFDACTARSTGGIPFSFPPKVPNGVRTAERKTISPLEVCLVIAREVAPSGRALAAADAELPGSVELGSASGAVFGRQILPAVRAVGDRSPLGKSAATITASLGDLHARQGGHREGGRAFVGRAVAFSTGGLAPASRVATGILRRYRNAEILHRFGNEGDARGRVLAKQPRIGVRGGDFALQPLLHGFVGADVAALSGNEPGDRRFVVLIGLDAQVAPVVTVRDQRVVQLGYRERHAEILGVPV